jgi:hypothetical protein
MVSRKEAENRTAAFGRKQSITQRLLPSHSGHPAVKNRDDFEAVAVAISLYKFRPILGRVFTAEELRGSFG